MWGGYFFPCRIPVEFMRQAGIQSGWMEWEAAVDDTKSTSSGGVHRERCREMSKRNSTTKQRNKVSFCLRWHIDMTFSRVCPPPAHADELNNKNVILPTTNPSPFQLPPQHRTCIASPGSAGGRSRRSVPVGTQCCGLALRNRRTGRRLLARLPKLTLFFFPSQFAVVCRSSFAKRGQEEPWTIYVFFGLRDIGIAFSFNRWVFHSLDASRALTRLTVSSRSRRRHLGGSRWTT